MDSHYSDKPTRQTSASRFRASISGVGPNSHGPYRTSFIGGNAHMGLGEAEMMDTSINAATRDEISFSAPAFGGHTGHSGHHRTMVDVFLQEEEENESAISAIVGMQETPSSTRLKTYGMWFCTLVVIMIIFVSVPSFGSSDKGGDNNKEIVQAGGDGLLGPELHPNTTTTEEAGSGVAVPKEETEAPPAQTTLTATTEHDVNRQQAIQAFLLEKGISRAAELRDTRSAAYQALEWMSLRDSAKLDVPGFYEHENKGDHSDLSEEQQGALLLQRFALATFYFRMEEEFLQGGEERHLLRHKRRRRNRRRRFLHGANSPSAEEFHRQDKFEEHWTVHNDTCSWFGVTCNDQDFIVDINLTHTLLEGKLVAELFQEAALPAMTSLDLSHNNLNGFFPTSVEIKNSKLTYLDLEHNQMEKSVEPILTQLRALQELDLTDNKFTGSLPDDWSEVSKDLVTIKIQGNALDGTLPTGLGLLTKLEWLQFDSNALQGSIPDEWAGLKSLHTLKMAHNPITGPLPSILGTLPLTHISLQDTHITGHVPTQLGELTTLQDVHLQMTQLTGTMPVQVCDLLGDGKVMQTLAADCKEEMVCECCTVCY